MRIAAHTVIVTTGVIGLIGSALAAEMTGADIKTSLSGNTAYLKNHRGVCKRASRERCDLLERGWYGPV